VNFLCSLRCVPLAHIASACALALAASSALASAPAASPAAPAAVTSGVPTTATAQPDVQRLHAVAPDGTRLAVQVRGPADAPAIVFVHGIAQSQLAFGRQVSSELARRYRLVTYDLRGHGESDKPTAEGAYASGRVMSDDLQAVIKAAGVQRPVLVGWSLGGIVVAQYLRDYGEEGIAGVNFVGARVAKPDGAPARMPGAAHLRTMLSEDLQVNIRATEAFVRACVAAPLAAEDFALMLGYNMATPVQARAATLKWSGSTDFAAALASLKLPVLITHGRQDQVIAPAVAEQAAKDMPHARLSWFDAAGHSPFFEDADRFNRELAEFVDAAARR